MARYAPIGSTQLDPRVTAADAIPEAPEGVGDAFAKGLRSGITSAGGQLRALAGGVGETVGANEFAQEQYAKARAAQQQAAAEAPEIDSYRKVDGVGTGLRYLAGQIGGAVPAIGAGIAGAALAPGAGPLAALAGATAATAPLEIGGAIERQQDDPEALKHSAGERLALAAGEGTLTAGLSNVVPQLVGGRVVGRGLRTVLKGGVGSLAEHTAEAVGGNALAGAGSEALHQRTADYLNPERDTSHDAEALKEAAVGGAAVGGVFAAAGAAKHLATGHPIDAVKSLVKDGAGLFSQPKTEAGAPVGEPIDGGGPAPLDPTGGGKLFKQKYEAVSKAFAPAGEPIDIADDRLTAAGRDPVVPGIETMPLAQQQAVVQKIDAERAGKARRTIEKLTSNPVVDEADRAKLAELGQRVDTDPDAVAAVAAMNVDYFERIQAAKRAEETHQALDSAYQGATDGETLAEGGSGVSRAIQDIILPPLQKAGAAAARDPRVLAAEAENLRRFLRVAEQGGDVPATARQNILDTFGQDTEATLVALHTEFGSTDPKQTDNFYRLLGKMTESQRQDQALKSLIRGALPDAAPAQLDAYLKGIRRFVGEELDPNLTPGQRNLLKRRFEDTMQQTFGEKTDAVMKAFAEDAKQRAKAEGLASKDREAAGVKPVVEKAEAKPDAEGEGEDTGLDLGEANDDGEHGELSGDGREVMNEADTEMTTRYYGGGKGFFNPAEPTFVLHPDAHRAAYGSEDGGPHDRLMQRALREHPDLTNDVGGGVRFMGAREYAALHGIDDARLHKLTGGKPDDHGLVVAERGHDPMNVTWDDFRKMQGARDKNGDLKTSTREADTMFDTEAGPVDAMAVLKIMQQKVKAEREKFGYTDLDDKATSRYRALQAFHEGIARLSEQLGEAVHVPDETVVLKDRGGRKVTYGELKKTEAPSRDEGWMKGMTDAEINAELERRDALGEASLHELRRWEVKAHQALEVRRGRANAEAAALRKAGKKVDFAELRKKHQLDQAYDAIRAVEREMERRDKGTAKERVLDSGDADGGLSVQKRAMRDAEHAAYTLNEKIRRLKDRKNAGEAINEAELERLVAEHTAAEAKRNAAVKAFEGKGFYGTKDKILGSQDKADNPGRGRTDIDPHGNVIEAKTVLGEKGIQRHAGYDDNELPKDIRRANADVTGIAPERRAAIETRARSMEGAGKSRTERVLGERLRNLVDKIDLMRPAEKNSMMRVADMDQHGNYRMPTSDAAAVINRLHDAYGGRRVPARRDYASMGGDIHENALKRIAENNRPKDLQAALVDLLRDKHPNQYKRAIIDAMNTRISELLARDPGAAYQLVTHGELEEHDDLYDDLYDPDFKTKEEREKEEAEKVKRAARLDAMILKEDWSKLTSANMTLRFLEAARERYNTLRWDVATPEEGKVFAWLRQQFEDQHSDLAMWMREAPGFHELPESEQAHYIDAAEALHGQRRAEEDAMFSKMAQGDGIASNKERKMVARYIERTLGGQVRALFEKLSSAGKFSVDEVNGALIPTVRVSVHALNPQSVGYHEALHAWFHQMRDTGGLKDVMDVLYRAADSAPVKNQLRRLLKGEPEALKQIEDSMEERVAYMFQFYAEGKLKLGDGSKTMLHRLGDFFARVMGVWTNDRRAQHIMDYFHTGEYGKDVGNVDAVRRATLEDGRNKTLDHLRRAVEPLERLGDAVATVGAERVRDTGVPPLVKIADLVRRHGTKEGADPGYIPAYGMKARMVGNELMKTLDRYDRKVIDETFDLMQRKRPVMPSQKHAEVRAAIRGMLDHMYDYMQNAGVDVGNRGYGRDYVPHQWNAAYIAGHQDEFRAMIQKYIDRKLYDGTADGLIARLVRNEGVEVNTDATMPGNQHIKERTLHFIDPDDAAPFLEKDTLRVLTGYIRQGAKRAEWARRFGDGNEQLDRMIDAARKAGATEDQITTAKKYIDGVNGQLGQIRPETRRMFGNIMVYQNLRLLPLGFFSSLIDPLGVGVRGGDLRDVFHNFKQGIVDIPRGFQKSAKQTEAYQFAEDVGVIDAAALMHALGTASGLSAVGTTARRVNETLFKFNLMEQMNTSQRVAATQAAVRFIMKHGKGDFNEHSGRYLAELGLRPADIKLHDGELAVREADFLALGQSADQARASFLKMSQAINTWVDGAVLRPDASQKAIWMNDPHFQLIAHMKQFAFAFQDTILKRAVHEMKHGNYTPAVALAGYVPVMLAADLMKGAIQGGGSQPAWKQDWDLGDYLASATQRAGLFGVGQFGIDAIKDLHHGGYAIGSLGGPTVDQLAEVASTVGGSRQFEPTLIDSMPANALWSGYLPNSATHSGGGHGRVQLASFQPTEPNTVD